MKFTDMRLVDNDFGKPLETAGRKATGTKAVIRYVSLAANYKRQTAGNSGTQSEGPKASAFGMLKAQVMAARPLIIISKPLEMAGRKAMGAKVLEITL